MRIKKADLQTLKSMGVRVSPWPTKEAEEKSFNSDVEKYMKWYEYSEEEAKVRVAKNFDCEHSWSGHWYNSTKVYISYDGGKMFTRTTGKSQVLKIEEIEKWIEKDKKAYSGTFGAFTIKMQDICKSMGYDKYLNVYPTTYGIGVWVFYNWNLEKDLKNIEAVLKEKGIEYYNEFSDAKWVFRFKISKKADNLAKIFAA